MKAGIYTYPWDLAAEGHDLALGRIAGAGFTAVNLACAYHAGKFLLPHNPRHRVYFAEDGAVYFRPDLARYDRIKPRLSSLVTPNADPLTELDRARRSHGLDLVAWVVCLHNTWLGEQYPDCAVRNAFGDPSPHSLCPAHPDVRAYLVALVTDIVGRAEVAAVELESPGYMGFIHDFHHEIIGIPLDPIQAMLLGLSFHPIELERARTAGVDGEGVRRRVVDLLTASWETGSPLATEAGPTERAQRLIESPEFVAYSQLRDRIVAELAAELSEAIHAVSPATEVRHFAALGAQELGLTPFTALAPAADGALTGYAASDAEARQRAADLRAVMGEKPVYGMVRALTPDTTDPAQIAPRIAAWRDSGVAGIDVYNYGLMSLPMLEAVGAAIRTA